MKFYASVCAIAKDEEPTIRAWAFYHLAIGFEHITLFDNNSAVPLKDVFADLMREGVVAVIDLDSRENQQLSAYFSYIKQFPSFSRWVAFIDIDEYVVPKKHADIKEFLADYEEFAGVGISWKIFGSNGHLARPRTSVPEAYPRFIGKDRQIKSIVQPQFVLKPVSPHHFEFAQDKYCVNEDRIPILGPFSYHSSETIQINHYYYQSQQDWHEKMERGFATRLKHKSGYAIEEFYRQARLTGEEDRCALKFLPRMRFLEKQPPGVARDVVQEDARTGCEGYCRRITQLILGSKAREAITVFRKAARYHDEAALYAIGMKLYLMTGDFPAFLATARTAILKTKDSPAMRKLILEALADGYARAGFPGRHAAIMAEITS